MARLLVLLMGCALVALAPLAPAATLHVPSQYPTIQAGMDAAVGGTRCWWRAASMSSSTPSR
jgi:hypothetical protein